MMRLRAFDTLQVRKVYCVCLTKGYWSPDFYAVTQKLPSAFNAVNLWLKKHSSEARFYSLIGKVYYEFYFTDFMAYRFLRERVQLLYGAPDPYLRYPVHTVAKFMYRVDDYARLVKHLGYEIDYTDKRNPAERDYRISLGYDKPQPARFRNHYWKFRK